MFRCMAYLTVIAICPRLSSIFQALRIYGLTRSGSSMFATFCDSEKAPPSSERIRSPKWREKPISVRFVIFVAMPL